MKQRAENTVGAVAFDAIMAAIDEHSQGLADLQAMRLDGLCTLDELDAAAARLIAEAKRSAVAWAGREVARGRSKAEGLQRRLEVINIIDRYFAEGYDAVGLEEQPSGTEMP